MPVLRLGLLFILASLLFAACDDEAFDPPAKPDLYKPPYDFALFDGGGDGGGGDLARSKDLGMPDLSLPHDLSESD